MNVSVRVDDQGECACNRVDKGAVFITEQQGTLSWIFNGAIHAGYRNGLKVVMVESLLVPCVLFISKLHLFILLLTSFI